MCEQRTSGNSETDIEVPWALNKFNHIVSGGRFFDGNRTEREFSKSNKILPSQDIEVLVGFSVFSACYYFWKLIEVGLIFGLIGVLIGNQSSVDIIATSSLLLHESIHRSIQTELGRLTSAKLVSGSIKTSIKICGPSSFCNYVNCDPNSGKVQLRSSNRKAMGMVTKEWEID